MLVPLPLSSLNLARQLAWLGQAIVLQDNTNLANQQAPQTVSALLVELARPVLTPTPSTLAPSVHLVPMSQPSHMVLAAALCVKTAHRMWIPIQAHHALHVPAVHMCLPTAQAHAPTLDVLLARLMPTPTQPLHVPTAPTAHMLL